jgi:hypothetical protein
MDLYPGNVLAYACPLTTYPTLPKVIILVTGESCAGNDHCADVWCSLFISVSHKSLRAQTLSISDTIKQGYTAATGADLKSLLWDHAYKEQQRPTLTKYFENIMRRRPQLLEEQFLQVLENGADMDVLLITGMRDEAPVASYSYLVPDSRLLEVHVEASKYTRQVRRGRQDDSGEDGKDCKGSKDCNEHPSFNFNNDMAGSEASERFFEHYLLPFFHEDLQRLANMVPPIPGFPRPGVQFRHVLEISQQPSGLALYTSIQKCSIHR